MSSPHIYINPPLPRSFQSACIVITGSIRHAAVQYLPAASAFYEAGVAGVFRAQVVVSDLGHAAERGVLIAAQRRASDEH